jgi:hypothetical protein
MVALCGHILLASIFTLSHVSYFSSFFDTAAGTFFSSEGVSENISSIS